MGGSETYARELLRELASVDIDVETLVPPVARGFSCGVREQVASEFPIGAGFGSRSRAAVGAAVHRRALARRVTHAQVVHFPLTVPVIPRLSCQSRIVTL